MQNNRYLDLLVLERRRYQKLTEIYDLTQQLAESVDRQDSVSIQMLLSMRQQPILELVELQGVVEEAARLSNGDKTVSHFLEETQDGIEMQLAEQRAKSQRLLEKLISLDERVSRKLGGNQSFYAQTAPRHT